MKPCCEDEKNRSAPEKVDGKDDLVVTVCKVCGCRHFEATADPGKLGVLGAKL